MSSLPHLKVQTGLRLLAVPTAKTGKWSRLPVSHEDTECSLTAAALRGKKKEGPIRIGRTVQAAPPPIGTSLQPQLEGAGRLGREPWAFGTSAALLQRSTYGFCMAVFLKQAPPAG